MTPLVNAIRAIETEDAPFAELLHELYASGYTGSITVHCVRGVPSVVEFPARQVRLQVTRLDKPGERHDPPSV